MGVNYFKIQEDLLNPIIDSIDMKILLMILQ